MTRYRRQCRADGGSHAEVEDALCGAITTMKLGALAFYGDKERGGDVLKQLNTKYGRWAGDVFQQLKEGAHKGIDGDLHQFVKASEQHAYDWPRPSKS